MSWIKAEYRFDEHAAILTLSTRDRHIQAEMVALVGGNSDNLDHMEKVFTEMILRHRPELRGGYLFSIRFDPYMSCWEFGFVAAELPAVKMGDMMPRMTLIPERPVVIDNDLVEYDMILSSIDYSSGEYGPSDLRGLIVQDTVKHDNSPPIEQQFVHAPDRGVIYKSWRTAKAARKALELDEPQGDEDRLSGLSPDKPEVPENQASYDSPIIVEGKS